MAAPEIPAQKSEVDFKALFQHAAIGILVAGQDGGIKFVNPIVETLFGYNKAELLGQAIEILMPSKFRLMHKQHRNTYFKNPTARPMGKGIDLYAQRKDGTVFPVEISLGHYTWENNPLTVAFITDITERKRIEDEIEEDNQWLEFLNKAMSRLWNISNLTKGLREILSTSIKLLKTNQGNVQLLDSEKQVLLIATQKGCDIAFLDHFSTVSVKSKSVYGKAFHKRKQIVVNDIAWEPFFAPYLQVAKNNGFRSMQITPFFDQNGLPIGMVSTYSPYPGHFGKQALRRMELYARYAEGFWERIKNHEAIVEINLNLEDKIRERTHALADALQREKEMNELKSRLVSIASHEFCTPLAAIQSSAFLAKKYTEPNQQDKRDKHLDRIQLSVKNLTHILNNFLSLYKLEQGIPSIERARCNFQDFLQEIVAELDFICKKGQTIRCNYKGKKETMLDRKIMRNILLNLLSNAIKYSDEDIDLITNVTDQHIIITVKDKGIGIPIEEQKKIFGKFFRAKNAGYIQGTGLGLNIVNYYIELLGGTINFTSKENEGTTFVVALPIEPVSDQIS